jgi:hypothetical protein
MDLITLAEQVGAAADLDARLRDQFVMELDFGDTSCAIGMAVLDTRTPLPADLLAHVLQRAPGWYASDHYRQLVIDAATRQLQQAVA